MKSKRKPESFLPLKPEETDILIEICRQEVHGYKIMTTVNKRNTPDRSNIYPASLYRVIEKLENGGLIQKVENKTGDARRKCYQITELGIMVLIAEKKRMQAQIMLINLSELS